MGEKHKSANQFDKEIKEREERVKQKVETHFEGSRFGRVIGYIIAALIAGFFLLILNKYMYYATIGDERAVYPFVTGAFLEYLPIASTVLIITIIGYGLLIIYDKFLFRQILQIIMDILTLVSIVALLIIFPFGFDYLAGTIAPWLKAWMLYACLGVGVFGTVAGIVNNSVKIFTQPEEEK